MLRRLRRTLLSTAVSLSFILSATALVLWPLTWFGFIYAQRQWVVQKPSWAQSRFVCLMVARGGLELRFGSNWLTKEFVDVAGTSIVERSDPITYIPGRMIYPSDGYANLGG